MIIKKIIIGLIALCVFSSGNLTIFGQATGSNSSTNRSANDSKIAKRTEKVKSQITKLGTGTKARVELRLIDGSKVKGYVSQINSGSFFVAGEQGGTSTEIQFANVEKVAGRNLSTGKKILIGFGIAVGAYILLALIGLHYAD